jgi:hypothetical protein
MSFFCECCVLSGRGLCDGLITRPEESYRLWCMSECDREASVMRRLWPSRGLLHHGGKNIPRKAVRSTYRICLYGCKSGKM